MTSEKKYHQDGDDIREYTEAEYAQAATDLAAAQVLTDKAAQVATDKASATAKLEALGLTANDLKALGL